MSNVGQGLSAVAGAAIGFAIGGPAGAVYGFSAGSTAGSLFFPTKLPGVEGPRITDAVQPPTIVGTALALTYGTGEIRGLPVWLSDYVEHVNKSASGGKGGPSQTTKTYTYTRSYGVLFGCRPKAGCLAIKRNGLWVYDIRPQGITEDEATYQARLVASQGYLSKIEIHNGALDQLPSPTMEAVEGIGNVPAYRSRPMIVFVNDDVTDTNTLPADVVAVWADTIEDNTDDLSPFSASVLYPWLSGNDPRNCKNDHQFRNGHTGTWRDTIEAAIADTVNPMSANGVAGWRFPQYGDNSNITQLNMLGNPGNPGDSTYVILHVLDHTPGGDPGSCASGVCTQPFRAPNGQAKVIVGNAGMIPPDYGIGFPWVNPITSATTFATVADMVAALTLTGPQNIPDFLYAAGYRWAPFNYSFTSWNGGSSSTDQTSPAQQFSFTQGLNNNVGAPTAYQWSGAFLVNFPYVGFIDCRRVVRAPDTICNPRCTSVLPGPLPENADYCVAADGTIGRYDDVWTNTASTYKWLSSYVETGTVVTSYPHGVMQTATASFQSVIRSDDPLYSNKGFWDLAYFNAVSLGLMPAGYLYSASGTGGAGTYPVVQTFAWTLDRQFDVSGGVPVSLQYLLTDLAARAGLDVGEMISTLPVSIAYMIINAQSNARSIIEQLQTAYLFDLIDVDVLTAVARGGAIVRTYGYQEVGAYDDSTQAPAVRVLPELTEPAELPASVTVLYLDPVSYASAEQRYGSMTADQDNAVSIDLAIAMSADQARQLAEIIHTQLHIAGETYTTTIGMREIARLPGDVIELPMNGETTRARITSIQGGLPGLLQVKAVRDDAAGWTSSATGTDSPPSGGFIVIGPSILTLLDLPYILSGDDGATYRAIVYAPLSGWRGASVQRSTDSGNSYTEVATLNGEAAQGTVGTPPAAGRRQWTWDRDTVLQVSMLEGLLSSATDAAVLSGSNLAAYAVTDTAGVVQGWELIQFCNAVQDSGGRWNISKILWGRRGTEWAIGQHRAGDRLVILNDGVARVAAGSDLIGEVVPHRAVSFGTTPDSAAIVDFTPEGVALVPLAPNYLHMVDNALRWVPRSRIFDGKWRDGLPVPFDPNDSGYDYQIYWGGSLYASGTTTVALLDLTAALAVHPTGLSVTVEHRSAVIGDGYPASINL